MQHLKNAYYRKKILITGGAGFIGSHLAEKCHELGANVTILDNFSTGRFDNIAHFAEHITCHDGDIRDLSACVRAARNIDIIFHLAAVTSVPESFEHPATYYHINVQGTLNMLIAATENMTQRFILASSAAVYGNYEGMCTETITCNPLSPYGFSKYMGEHICQQFAYFHRMSTVCLRYFNVYGPRQRGDLPHAGMIAHLRYCLEHNLPFTIYGTGQQQRDFIPVQDVVMANLIFGAYASSYSPGEVYNIGSGKPRTVQQMINEVRSQFPNHPDEQIKYAPARQGDVAYSGADCSKYHEFKIRMQEI